MNKHRILSGLYGLMVVAVGIWLDAHGAKSAGQIFVMTAIALAAPVGVAVVANALWRPWVFVALVSSAVIHTVFLWSVRGSLPFSTLGVAILMGTLECFGLTFVSAKISELI